jgi:hypothetical protein
LISRNQRFPGAPKGLLLVMAALSGQALIEE